MESWATGEVCLQFSYRMSTCFLTHSISSVLKFFHCSTALPTLRLIRLFGFCQSGGRVMVSHEVECFHMFVDHLSVQGFGLVFYCVICLLLVLFSSHKNIFDCMCFSLLQISHQNLSGGPPYVKPIRKRILEV